MCGLIPETDCGHLHSAAVNIYEHTCQLLRPSVIFQPLLRKIGANWEAVYGKNKDHSGVTGVGRSPEEAMRDFDVQWYK